MRVSLKSVSGVDAVDVSLAKGLAAVKMKPGNTATLKQLQDAITKNGFTMKQSTASIAGTVVLMERMERKTLLKVAGSGEILELIPESPAVPNVSLMIGRDVLVEGTIPEAAKGKKPDSIRYRSITEQKAK